MNDLRGMRLAINGPTALNHAWRVLEYHGMRLDDVQIENVSFPEQLPALTNQAIDAAMPLEPFVTIGQDRGILEPIFDVGYAMPNYPAGMVFYSADFIQNQSPHAIIWFHRKEGLRMFWFMF